MNSVYHIPVLRDEAVYYLIIPAIKDEIIVDGTLGGGGYSELILKRLSKNGKLISIDKDINAIEFSQKRLNEFGSKITIVQGNFAGLKGILEELNVNVITGIVLDLGLSSFQLTDEEGFSFLKNTRLDMRADKNSEVTAEYILNEYGENELTRIFEEYGEIRNARRLSGAIVSKRKTERIVNTNDFVKIVQREYEMKKDIPRKFFSKIFQALRIAVNDELNDLR